MAEVYAEWAEAFYTDGCEYEIKCPDCRETVRWNPASDYQDLTCNCDVSSERHGYNTVLRTWEFSVVAFSQDLEST